MILTYRPEFQPPWSSRSYLMSIALIRFSQVQVEEMSKYLTNGKLLPTSVLEQVVEKSDGVPLFIEELTKAIVESGQLQDRGDRYELIAPLSNVSIPSTLQDSLMARLDRLGEAKTVAQ